MISVCYGKKHSKIMKKISYDDLLPKTLTILMIPGKIPLPFLQNNFVEIS